MSKLRALEEVQYVFDETPVTVKSLTTKELGRTLLLGQALDRAVQDYITSMHETERSSCKHRHRNGSRRRNHSCSRLELTCAAWRSF